MKLNKTLIITLASALVGFAAHATVKLEVAPLQAKVKAQVLGVRVGFSGEKAIAFTGRTAKKLAVLSGNAAFKAFDSSKQMLVATGSEASSLVAKSYSNAKTAGRVVLATGAGFAQDAVGLDVSDSLKAGEAVLSLQPLKGADIVASALKNAATDTVTLVADGSAEIVQAGEKVVSDSAQAVFSTVGVVRQAVKSSSSF